MKVFSLYLIPIVNIGAPILHRVGKEIQILDRLVHTAHRIELTGESLRGTRGKRTKGLCLCFRASKML
jgi:hypothetical protein